MYHQILPIGEGQVPAAIDYDIDPDCNVLFIGSITVNGAPRDIGEYDKRQIEDIESQLAKRHDSVTREMDSLFREDRAADRAAFRETYA